MENWNIEHFYKTSFLALIKNLHVKLGQGFVTL